MGVHRIHTEGPLTAGVVQVLGDEAHHAARVKRVEVGGGVELLDGRGGVGRGVVANVCKARGEWVLEVRVEDVKRVEPPLPRLEVCTAVPKGSGLSEMIDGLAQAGAAVWRPLETERGVREGWRREKLERTALEASKQCGRAWRMEIGEGLAFEEGLAGATERGPGGEVMVADAGGEKYEARGERVRLLVGPEGGWTGEELEMARRAGARVCRFGVHVMRIETAAVVAAGVVMEAGEGIGR